MPEDKEEMPTEFGEKRSMTWEYDAWPKVDVLSIKELKRIKHPRVLLEKKKNLTSQDQETE